MRNDFLKIQQNSWIILIGAACFLSAIGGDSYAQNSKKVGNLNFQVPDEWPVEKRGGMLTPVPTEEYVTIKFKEIEKEFLSVRDEFSEKFVEFQLNLKVLEKNLSKEIEKVHSTNGAQGGSAADLSDILSGIEAIKGELARLDRKITNKTQELQGKLDGALTEIKLMKEKMDGFQAQIYRIDEKADYLKEDQGRSY